MEMGVSTFIAQDESVELVNPQRQVPVTALRLVHCALE